MYTNFIHLTILIVYCNYFNINICPYIVYIIDNHIYFSYKYEKKIELA